MIRFYFLNDDNDIEEFTDRVNLDDRNMSVTSQAEMAAVGSCNFLIDDPLGEFVIKGHRLVLVIEDDAPSENQLIWGGYSAGRDLNRADETPVLAARGWTLNLVDVNSLMARKVMAGNDTDRPAESDVERVQWALSTGEAGLFGDVTTYVSTSSPVNMDAADYNGQMFNNIIDDCAQQSGKNFYVRWIWDTDHYTPAVWYGKDTVALAETDLQISNVISDVDDIDTWFGSMDSTLTRDPSRVYSGVFANYDGGFTYQTRPETIDEFANRDTITSWPNVKTHTTAVARAIRYLGTLHDEEDVVKTSILVPPANVNDAVAGDLIAIKFTHLDGYEAFRDCRVLNRTVTFVTPEVYQIDYEVSPVGGLATCTTSVSSLEITTTGIIHDTTGPTTTTPTTPAFNPALLIGGWFGTEGTGFMLGTPALASPYIEAGRIDGTSDPGTHTYVIGGYDAYAGGTPDDFEVSGFSGSGGNPDARGFVAAIETSATAPVQWKQGSTSTITFDAPTTPGNMLVMLTFGEGESFPTPDPPLYDATHEWTHMVRYDDTGGNIGLGGFSSGIYTACISEAATEYNTGSGAFSHWMIVYEVEIT